VAAALALSMKSRTLLRSFGRRLSGRLVFVEVPVTLLPSGTSERPGVGHRQLAHQIERLVDRDRPAEATLPAGIPVRVAAPVAHSMDHCCVGSAALSPGGSSCS